MSSPEVWDEYELAQPDDAPQSIARLRGVISEFPLHRPDRSLPQDAGQDFHYEFDDDTEFVRSYDTVELLTAMRAAGVESLLDDREPDPPAASVVRPPGHFGEDWDPVVPRPVQASSNLADFSHFDEYGLD